MSAKDLKALCQQRKTNGVLRSIISAWLEYGYSEYVIAEHNWCASLLANGDITMGLNISVSDRDIVNSNIRKQLRDRKK